MNEVYWQYISQTPHHTSCDINYCTEPLEILYIVAYLMFFLTISLDDVLFQNINKLC